MIESEVRSVLRKLVMIFFFRVVCDSCELKWESFKFSNCFYFYEKDWYFFVI